MDVWAYAASISLVSARTGCGRLARVFCGVPCRRGVGSYVVFVSSGDVRPSLRVDP